MIQYVLSTPQLTPRTQPPYSLPPAYPTPPYSLHTYPPTLLTLPADSTVYFGVGFYQGERGVGRDYQMAFYNVNSTNNGPLEVTSTITTRVAESWLKCKYLQLCQPCLLILVHVHFFLSFHVSLILS